MFPTLSFLVKAFIQSKRSSDSSSKTFIKSIQASNLLAAKHSIFLSIIVNSICPSRYIQPQFWKSTLSLALYFREIFTENFLAEKFSKISKTWILKIFSAFHLKMFNLQNFQNLGEKFIILITPLVPQKLTDILTKDYNHRSLV